MSKRKKGSKKSSKPTSPSGRGGSYSSIPKHQKVGTALIPPLGKAQGLTVTSWIDNRLPEMLWGALLLKELGRSEAINIFRGVFEHIRVFAKQPQGDLSLSGLSEMPSELVVPMLQKMCAHRPTAAALRPLLLFDQLPGRDRWEIALAHAPPATDWHNVVSAVSEVMNPRSQASTDLRWARLMLAVKQGFIKMPEEMSNMLASYADTGSTDAGACARAAELLVNDRLEIQPRSWSSQFWATGLAGTACQPVQIERYVPAVIGTTVVRLNEALSALAKHSAESSTTSMADPRHETVFGMAAYCLTIISEIMRVGNSSGVLGVMGLRTILEAFITLKYLHTTDTPDLWQSYRSYGNGQAKLAFLKLDESGRVDATGLPSSIDVDLLELLAGEDLWLELVTINIGNWGSSDLRKMSDQAGIKGEYDKFYAWTSAFVHANWTAIRLMGFDICENPMHRLHRVLRDQSLPLEDVLGDAILLTDGVLEIVSDMYPSFSQRLSIAV